jgi:ribose transport system substrate-binding protein
MTRIIVVFVLCLVFNPLLVQAQEKLKIAVIPKGDDSFFWQAVHKGAQSCGAVLGGVEVDWMPPKVAQDVKQQIELVDQCTRQGIRGIVLSPSDYALLAAPVARAVKKGIPVLVFDSRLKGEPGKDYISYVSTDSRNGGMLAGDAMAKILGGKRRVLVLRYTVGQANLSDRGDGFVKAIQNYKDIHVVSKYRSEKPTAENAKAAGESMIDELRTMDGVFCPNEPTTEGMLKALQNAHLNGKIKFIGFDTSDPLVQALKNGDIDALVAQDPTKMGYFAVETLVEHIRGTKVPPVIDIGVRVITRENIGDPEIQKLIAMPSLIK